MITKPIDQKDIKFYKKYEIRCEIREIKDDIQLLIFADEDLVFATRRKTLYIRDYVYQNLKLNKFYLPVFYDVIQTKVQFKEPNEKIRYMKFCSLFKRAVCLDIQNKVRETFSNYGKNCKATAI